MAKQHTAEDSRFTVPLYTLAEAGRAVGVPPSTFASWAKGYSRRFPTRVVEGAAIVTAFPAEQGRPSVPFIGLAEGLVLAAVRRAKVPMQRVRPALDVLAREIGLNHALASKSLYTDGAELLYDYATHAKDDAAKVVKELVVVRSRQRVFTDVVSDYLKRIDYGPDGYARLVRLPGFRRADVVADADRSFGQPIFARGGARVSDVLERFWAGDDIETVAREFGVPAADVEDALRAASARAA